ncbi:MAG: OBG GTPase family GTP-binding protein [Methanosarcinales archaeon]
MGIEDEIIAIKEEIRKTPYNKATSHHIGRLKAKLARLKEELQKRSVKSGGVGGYSIKKSGDATVVLVGFPSVGKSTLLNRLTDAKSQIDTYDFTTLNVIPGTLEYKGAKIQILDVPGLVQGASIGKGRGKEVISVVRNADLILLLIDVFNVKQHDVLVQELYDAGIRINTHPPDITIRKKDRGGININSTLNLSLSKDTIFSILKEYKIHNADILIREDLNIDEFIDALCFGNRKYISAITVINKIDLVDLDFLKKLKNIFPDAIMISADKDKNLQKLKDRIFKKLRFMRIYLKPHGKPPDLKEPMILRTDSTVEDVCNRIHKDFKKKFRYAKVWGNSAKHKGQKVGLDHKLCDEDILTVILG